jgi:hypothetical protein
VYGYNGYSYYIAVNERNDGRSVSILAIGCLVVLSFQVLWQQCGFFFGWTAVIALRHLDETYHKHVAENQGRPTEGPCVESFVQKEQLKNVGPHNLRTCGKGSRGGRFTL